MSEPGQFNLWEWLLSSFRPFEVVSGIATVVWVISWLLKFPTPLLYMTGTAAFVCFCVGAAGHIKSIAERPTITLGTLSDEVFTQSVPQRIAEAKAGVSSNEQPRLVETTEPRRVSVRALEEEYEVTKLEPNFLDFGDEQVMAYNDENGVIVQGQSPSHDSFPVLVRSFGNQHPRKRVKSLNTVGFRLNFICFDRETKNKGKTINIHRGAWLNEENVDVGFPAHCPPRRAVVITVEGDNKIYAIRRDSDSAYKGILPLREELTGGVYTVFLTLLVESRNAKAFQYILEIIREPSVELRFTTASLWKSEHLHKFIAEGFAFSTKLHEIWRDANDQVPPPPTTNVLLDLNKVERITYPDYLAQIRAIEREQEEKIVQEIKSWEMRAADFVDLFIGAEQRDKLVKSVPSIDAGFNRAQRRGFLLAPLPDGEPRLAPKLPYWTLSDSVSSRIDMLMKINEHL